MARPRKVISMQTGHRTNNEKAVRQSGEKHIKAKKDALSAPNWLSDVAALEFERVVHEAEQIDMLDNLDLSVLAVYADNYSQYVAAATYLNIHGAVMKTQNGYETPSPWLKVKDQAAKNIFSCSTKLGLAVTDRLKLITPVKEEKSVNKYIQFLGDANG